MKNSVYNQIMEETTIPLHEIIHRAHEDLATMVPADDLRLPDGERLASATYVHVQLPMLAASLQGYGFEDSALTPEARALTGLSIEDRWDWLSQGHDATVRGASWVRPHLSRSTLEYLEDGTGNESAFSHAVSMLPPPLPIGYDGTTDRDGYAVVVRCQDADYLVPMDDIAVGKVGSARRVAGLGAGLSNAANWDEALVGDPTKGVNGRWTTRPLTQSANGPVMVVGIEWQGQADETESRLARNAADQHRIIHQTRPSKSKAVNIAYTVPILPQVHDPGMG